MLVGVPDVDSGSSHRDSTKEDCSRDSNLPKLVKVKAHRGEPANEGVDILVDIIVSDKAISDPQRVVPTDESSSLPVEKTVP
jgi:hypothetical protein